MTSSTYDVFWCFFGCRRRITTKIFFLTARPSSRNMRYASRHCYRVSAWSLANVECLQFASADFRLHTIGITFYNRCSCSCSPDLSDHVVQCKATPRPNADHSNIQQADTTNDVISETSDCLRSSFAKNKGVRIFAPFGKHNACNNHFASKRLTSKCNVMVRFQGTL